MITILLLLIIVISFIIPIVVCIRYGRSEVFYMMLNMKPWDAGAWVEYGKSLYMKENYVDAYRMFDKAIILDPTFEGLDEKKKDCLDKMGLSPDFDLSDYFKDDEK
jgi:hypothetical protein